MCVSFKVFNDLYNPVSWLTFSFHIRLCVKVVKAKIRYILPKSRQTPTRLWQNLKVWKFIQLWNLIDDQIDLVREKYTHHYTSFVCVLFFFSFFFRQRPLRSKHRPTVVFATINFIVFKIESIYLVLSFFSIL